MQIPHIIFSDIDVHKYMRVYTFISRIRILLHTHIYIQESFTNNVYVTFTKQKDERVEKM